MANPNKHKVVASVESQGTMGTWKARKFQKGARASREAGKKKGIMPSQLARYMCRANRSYKRADYASVMATLGVRKKSK